MFFWEWQKIKNQAEKISNSFIVLKFPKWKKSMVFKLFSGNLSVYNKFRSQMGGTLYAAIIRKNFFETNDY